MLRRLCLFTFSLIAIAQIALAQEGKLSGRVFDSKKIPAPSATVMVLKGTGPDAEIVNGAITDEQGYYSITPLEAGTYNVKADVLGATVEITGVTIGAGITRNLDISMPEAAVSTVDTTVITEFRIPVFERDPSAQGGNFTGEQFRKMGSRNLTTLAAQTPGVFQGDEGDFNISFRGSRDNGTQYIIDGVKVRGSVTIPQSAVGSMQVITGGTPAEFGDFTGGVVNITTSAPASKVSGGLELVTSEGLDRFGRNLIGANLSGPILQRTVKFGEYEYKRPLLGFFISGEYDHNRDNDPAYFGIYKISDERLNDLQENPMVYDPSLTTFVNRANYLNGNDLITIKTKQFNQDTRARGLGRLDFSPTENITIKLGASAEELLNNNAGGWSLRNMLLAPDAGSRITGGTYRTWLRFQQSFKTDTNSLLQNFFYVLQGDYTLFRREFRNRENLNNLWDYGYVGKINYDRTPFYRYVDDPTGSPFSSGPYWEVVGYGNTNLTFDGSDTRNPVLANANDYIVDYVRNTGVFFQEGGFTLNDVSSPDLLRFFNGYRNGDGVSQIYSLYTGTGANAGGYSRLRQEQFRLTGQATAEIKKHNIKVGFEFEQRVERQYGLGARNLWTFARLLANRQLQGLDKSNPTYITRDGEFQDTISYLPSYDAALQTNFDRKLRESLGMAIDGRNWINTDALSPSQMNLNFFNASELLFNGQGILGTYYGYDYLGNRSKRTDPAKFFQDSTTRNQNPFAPTYISAFIQDKFELQDIIFNLGLRVDRFDANQPVLKDNYLLYPAFSVEETQTQIRANSGNNAYALPSNVAGDGWVAYVDDIKNPKNVVGFRNGDVWYDANGVPTSSSAVASAGGGSVNPHVKRDKDQEIGIDAFTDYKPQTVFMPRMSFSFPISDNALFFAHYDVLAQRPGQLLSTQGSLLAGQLTDYLFLRTNPTIEIANPNLKPEVTIDYEAGFRQKISFNSSFSVSAYYREMRNMIQYRRFNNAYPITYNSYDNIDFGTVKGFTFSYLMRRIKQLEINASYTLQFASSTGSSFTSSRNVTDNLQGTALLRTLLPAGTDQRHRITATVDYRYGAARDAGRGPALKLGSKTIYPLDNAGANLTFYLGSGTPYSRQLGVTSILDGQVTGAQTLGTPLSNRLPWQFRTDLRLDKSFEFGGKVKEGATEPSRGYSVNVYLLALNVFNTMNITGVYGFTGLPFDDGFLASPQGQQSLLGRIDPQAFTDLYRSRLKNPDNVSLPRRIRLGVQLNF